MPNTCLFILRCAIAVAFSMTPLSSMSSGVKKLTNLKFVPPPPPTVDAPTGRSRGGASRGACVQVQPQLTAIAPIVTTTKQKTSVWGLTIADRPTIWVYVPYTRKLAIQAEFVLQGANNNLLSRTSVTLPTQAGVVGIKIPDSVAPLIVGQRYHWFFVVFCDTEKQLPPVSINGSIQRVALNSGLTRQLAQSNLLQQVETYAANGIWYDALTTLVQLWRANPQDYAIQQAWENLLQSAGQSEVAKAPIANY